MGIIEAMGKAAKSGRPFSTEKVDFEIYFFTDLSICVFFGEDREASDVVVTVGRNSYHVEPSVFGRCDLSDRDSTFETAVRLGIAKENQYTEG